MTTREVDSALRIRESRRMSPTVAEEVRVPFLRSLSQIPLFWKFQIAGWIAHAIISLPLKLAGFERVSSAILVALISEPLGFFLTWAMRKVYIRLRLRVEHLLRLAVWVMVCCTLAATIDYAVYYLIRPWIRFREVTPLVVFGMTWIHALQYFTWSFLYFGIKNAITARERAVNLIRAESAAREAELRMLRAQINPHFLFNSLNTVLAGLDRDPKALAAVVQGLADYLRYSLAHRHTTMVPLGEEFDAVMNYLLVEKARFRDDLQIDAYMDPTARAVPVPGVMLQPLIENAMKHGIKSSTVPLQLRICVQSTKSGSAIVEVANSGRWIEPPVRRDAGDASGFGLESLKRRLTLIYAGTHRFEICAEQNQVVVRIQVPSVTPSRLS